MIPALLAQLADRRADRLRMMGRHFQQQKPDGDVYFSVAISVLAIMAIFVVMKLVDHLQKRHDASQLKAQPMSLYFRVQSQLGMSLMERWQLWRLAKVSGTANPTALLISPALFDRAVSRYCQGSLSSGYPARLAAIRRRLFGRAEPLPVDPIPVDG